MIPRSSAAGSFICNKKIKSLLESKCCKSKSSYLGINAHTDAQGEVLFDLADGDYKFRADYFGYQFWSNDYTVPGTLSDVLTITHQDVTVTVNQVYGVDIDPLQGVNIYLFTGSGSYQGIYQATGANGQVTFNVPEKDYKVRADCLSAQYWSDVFSWQDVGVDINHGSAILHVTHNGQDVYDVPVYLFTESGSYLSRFERTDSSGQVQFLLPAGPYKFRVDYDGTQYWSDVVSIIAHEENSIDLQLELLADLTNDPNPDRFDGTPPIYEPEKVMVASLGSIRSLLVQSVVGQTAEEQKIYYFINDHLGTPQKLLNENADVVWGADYMPFGEADVYVNTFENQFRFPGQYYDEETRLHYNWHRYYDPNLGRYLRADPIGLEGGINLFAYCLNDPVNWIDPLGLFSPFGGPGFTNVMPNKPPSWSEQANNYPSPVPGLGEGVNMHNAIPGQFAVLGPAAIIETASNIDSGLVSPITNLIKYGTPPIFLPDPEMLENIFSPEPAEASECP